MQATVNWPQPPPDGYTAEDLDRIADLPPHTELIDGSLVFVTPQREFHSLTLDLLVDALRHSAPKGTRVRREMSLILDARQRPEPDIVVMTADAVTGGDRTAYTSEAVVLVVEVVSPESATRDRERKPQLYARAGIRHHWRIENDGRNRPVVYVYDLDPGTRAYALVGIFSRRLQLAVPFDVDIDLTAIDEL